MFVFVERIPGCIFFFFFYRLVIGCLTKHHAECLTAVNLSVQKSIYIFPQKVWSSQLFHQFCFCLSGWSNVSKNDAWKTFYGNFEWSIKKQSSMHTKQSLSFLFSNLHHKTATGQRCFSTSEKIVRCDGQDNFLTMLLRTWSNSMMGNKLPLRYG